MPLPLASPLLRASAPCVSDPYVSDPYVSDPYVSDPYVSDPYVSSYLAKHRGGGPSHPPPPPFYLLGRPARFARTTLKYIQWRINYQR